MKSLISSLNMQRLFVVLSITLGCILFCASALMGGRKQQGIEPVISSKADALRFEGLDMKDGLFEVRMKNVSDSAIAGYAIGVCGKPLFTADYTKADKLIEPGEVEKIHIPVQILGERCATRSSQPDVTILAVVFENQDNQGDFRHAKRLIDDWRGQKIQFERINALLKKAMKRANLNGTDTIERLKMEISSLPDVEGESPFVRSGLHSAKTRTLTFLEEINQRNQKQRGQKGIRLQTRSNIQLSAELDGITNEEEGLARLIALHDKWISKY